MQRRRELPTKLTQRLQVLVQDRILGPVLGSPQPLTLPWPMKVVRRWPWLTRIPARVVGVGFRPEHVGTPDVGSARGGS